MEVPLKPMGRKDIHLLEHTLLITTLLRKDVMEKIKDPEERLTWVDSLAVAAGALARSKAGMSVKEIAMELGRSEATIRNHLAEKTEAGKLVAETYKLIARGELQPLAGIEAAATKMAKVKEVLQEVKQKLEELLAELE